MCRHVQGVPQARPNGGRAGGYADPALRCSIGADIIRPCSIRHRNWAACSKNARVSFRIFSKSEIHPTLAGACR